MIREVVVVELVGGAASVETSRWNDEYQSRCVSAYILNTLMILEIFLELQRVQGTAQVGICIGVELIGTHRDVVMRQQFDS